MSCHSKTPPLTLADAVCLSPMIHLVPKQDIALLVALAPMALDAHSDDLDLSSFRAKAAVSRRIEASADIASVCSTIADDFRHFDRGSLDILRFPVPGGYSGYGHAKSDSTAAVTATAAESYNEHTTALDSILHNVDAFLRLFASVSATQTVTTTILRDPGSLRLSVRKKYPSLDSDELRRHHRKYARKIESELERAGFVHTGGKHPKRSLEVAENDHEREPNQQKRRRVVGNGETLSLEEELTHLIDELGGCDSTPTNGPDPKISAYLHEIHVKLTVGVADKDFSSLDVSVLLRLENQVFNFLCLSSEVDWKALEHLRDPRGVKSLLSTAKDYLVAAKILALILNTDRQEKQLYIYDYLALVINFMGTFCEDGLMPLAKLTVLNTIIVNSFRGAFSAVCNELEDTITLLQAHVSKREVNEDLLTKLEYTAMGLIFSETNARDKTSVIGVHQIELVKMAFSNLCATIFKKNPNQRSFIQNELLSNAYKVPLLKSTTRQFKTSRGTSIHLLTSTLLNLLQSYYADIPANWKYSTESSDDSLKFSTRIQTIEAAQIAFEDADRFATEISQYVVSYVASNPSPANKQSLEVLITDVLNILLYPEWPGAETLLMAILRSLLTAIRAEGSQDNFFLDMAGLIGVHLLTTRNNNPSALEWEFGDEDAQNNDNELRQVLRDVIAFVQEQGNRNVFYNNALHYLINKYLHYLSLQSESNLEGDLKVLQSLRSSPDVTSGQQYKEIFLLLVQADSGRIDDFANKAKNPSTTFDKIMLPYYRTIGSMSINYGVDSFLSTLVKCLQSNKAAVKSRALKVLSNVVNKDSKVMIIPSIRDCIAKRLLDNSSSVREAVIDLITKYMHTRTGVVDQYYRPICHLLSDDSLQVRRRVLKLCKDLYLSTEIRSTKSYIAIEVLKRRNDIDESIREIVSATLTELWFTNAENDKLAASESLRTAEVMMDVVSKDESSFKKYIMDTINDGETPLFQSQLTVLVSNILDFVDECQDTQFQPQVEKAMKLIVCLTQCRPSLISQDMVTSIRPYIMDESLAKGSVGYYSLILLNLSLTELKAVRPELLESIQLYLMKNLSKYSQAELIQVMPCLWKLCEESQSTEKLANATLSCIQMSRSYIAEFSNKGHIDRHRNLQKILTLMSFLGTECDLDRHRDLFEKSNIGLQDNETVISLLTRIVMVFSSSKMDEQTYAIAISALMRFCTHNPKMFSLAVVSKTIDKVFQIGNPRATLSVIESIQQLIDYQDTDDENHRNKASMFNHVDRLKSQARENICGRFIQRHLPDLLDMSILCEPKYQYGVFSFLESMIKGGFSNPKTCIPTVLAFGSSQSKKIRERALLLYKELFTKHESLVETSYVEGIRLAAAMSEGNSGSSMTSDYLATLYSVANQSIGARKKLLNSIIKVLTINFKRNTDPLEQLDQVKFVATRLTHIKFSTIEEVCLIIYNLDQTISIAGMNYVEQLDKMDVSGEEAESVHLHCQSLILVVLLREYLATCYSITSTQLDTYRPNRATQSLRQAPRIVNQIPFDVSIAHVASGASSLMKDILRVITTTKKLMHKYA